MKEIGYKINSMRSKIIDNIKKNLKNNLFITIGKIDIRNINLERSKNRIDNSL